MEAKFWDEGEDLVATERARANQMGIVNRKWRWDHVLEALLDLKSWCWFIIVLSISLAPLTKTPICTDILQYSKWWNWYIRTSHCQIIRIR